MNNEAIRKAYSRYARMYDAVFGPVLHPGRRLIVEAMDCQPGDRVLEVGVGTGLSLPLYASDVRVTGLDISTEMLDLARERVERDGLDHVEAVLEEDAEHMSFPDGSFDRVIAMYIVSVVPDPARLIEEMRRVCKPGGDIFIVNHFRSRNALLGLSEALLSPLSRLAGFRTNLDLDELVRETRLVIVDRRRANLFGYWTMLRCRNASLDGEDREPVAAQARVCNAADNSYLG